MRAVILAAGEGKRLRPYFDGPKPLTPLLGLSLIERNILSLRECGINNIIITTGYKAPEIKNYLGDGTRYGVSITYVYKPDWKLGNGVSAFSFQQHFRNGEKFILMMSDHIFGLEVLKSFIASAKNIDKEEILLAADKRLQEIFDVTECTKIQIEQNRAILLGKKIESFNAVDCGLFMGTGALLQALSQAISQSRYTLTDAVNILAARRQVKIHLVNGFWADVDDICSYQYAEKMLLDSLVPAKDGAVSRFLNRKVSLKITKLLARTGVTPNQVTFSSFLTAVTASILFSFFHPALGGLLAQLTSIIDGVDGEIARLKFLKSNFGGLLDAIFDRYADFLIILGMAYAWYSTAGNAMVLLVSMATLAGLSMSMLLKEKFHALTGKPFLPEVHDGIFRYLPGNRDGRLFIIMLGGIFNLIPATLILLAVVTHLQTLVRLYTVRRLM